MRLKAAAAKKKKKKKKKQNGRMLYLGSILGGEKKWEGICLMFMSL